MEILLLCKVVDNYGDIGFVYRLARALSDLDGSLRLALAVSDLASFAYMAPGLDASLSYQRYCGWDVLDWNDAAACSGWCREHGVRFVLECFQCGRPDWLEDYLFGGGLPAGQTAHVVNLEYLTAEDWAEEFHLLKGGTRSPSVKKVNFLPGFTPRTGGLLLDRAFMRLLADRGTARASFARSIASRASPGGGAAAPVDLAPGCCTVLVFSYERDFAPLVRAFERCHAEGERLAVYLAPGRGAASFRTAYEGEGCRFPLVELPRLDQEVWDALLASCDLAFVRGEESFARACLASRPFVWHAYRQDGAFHLVKLAALLNRMRGFFPAGDFSLLAEFFLLYNMPDMPEVGGHGVCGLSAEGGGGIGAEAAEAVALACPGLLPRLAESGFLERRLEELAYGFLKGRGRLAPCFAAFSSSLVANGDLAAHLLEYLRGLN